MICQNCQTNNSESNDVCYNCGNQIADLNSLSGSAGAEYVINSINNHFIKAIIATLLCTPFGVVALIYSILASMKIKDGDMDSAELYSKRANTWANVIMIIYLIIVVIIVTRIIAEY